MRLTDVCGGGDGGRVFVSDLVSRKKLFHSPSIQLSDSNKKECVFMMPLIILMFLISLSNAFLSFLCVCVCMNTPHRTLTRKLQSKHFQFITLYNPYGASSIGLFPMTPHPSNSHMWDPVTLFSFLPTALTAWIKSTVTCVTTSPILLQT